MEKQDLESQSKKLTAEMKAFQLKWALVRLERMPTVFCKEGMETNMVWIEASIGMKILKALYSLGRRREYFLVGMPHSDTQYNLYSAVL